jgi:hypothetical protein
LFYFCFLCFSFVCKNNCLFPSQQNAITSSSPEVTPYLLPTPKLEIRKESINSPGAEVNKNVMKRRGQCEWKQTLGQFNKRESEEIPQIEVGYYPPCECQTKERFEMKRRM